MSLHRPPHAGHTTVLFYDAPVAMLLPVLPAYLVAQKNMAADFQSPRPFRKGLWSAPFTRDFRYFSSAVMPGFSKTYRRPAATKFPEIEVQLRKSG